LKAPPGTLLDALEQWQAPVAFTLIGE